MQVVAESSYKRLLDSGVDIWNFQTTMLHAKVMTVDEHIAVVGSANFNSRSMSLDEEINVVLIDDVTASTLDQQFEVVFTRAVSRTWTTSYGWTVAGEWSGHAKHAPDLR